MLLLFSVLPAQASPGRHDYQCVAQLRPSVKYVLNFSTGERRWSIAAASYAYEVRGKLKFEGKLDCGPVEGGALCLPEIADPLLVSFSLQRRTALVTLGESAEDGLPLDAEMECVEINKD